jgi:hypothetical protein
MPDFTGLRILECVQYTRHGSTVLEDAIQKFVDYVAQDCLVPIVTMSVTRIELGRSKHVLDECLYIHMLSLLLSILDSRDLSLGLLTVFSIPRRLRLLSLLLVHLFVLISLCIRLIVITALVAAIPMTVASALVKAIQFLMLLIGQASLELLEDNTTGLEIVAGASVNVKRLVVLSQDPVLEVVGVVEEDLHTLVFLGFSGSAPDIMEDHLHEIHSS